MRPWLNAIRPWLVLSLFAPAPAWSQSGLDHAMAQVGRLHQLRQFVDSGRIDDAHALIEAAKSAAKDLPTNEPRRMDAEELQVALLAAQEAFAAARPISIRVIKARQSGPPGEQLLACWSLLQHAIILDATGDTRAADSAMQSSLVAAREAFPSGDPRRPRMIEAFADLMARGYNRPIAGIRLYEAAIEIREATPTGSDPAELAEALRKLALLEPAQGLDTSADAHLSRAITILQTQANAAKDKATVAELEGDLATLYLSRIGIAARAMRFDDAKTLLVAGRTHAANTGSAPFIELMAADVDRREREAHGETGAAIAAVRRAIAIALAIPDHRPTMVADLELVEGRLQIEQADFDGAEVTVDRALKTYAASPQPEGARTAEGWLLLARIERARHQEERAKRWVTAALTMLKTRRSEVPVLFGTNRARDPREPAQFGTAIAPAMTLGEALVLVPGTAPVAGAGLTTLGSATALDRMLVTNTTVLEPSVFDEAAKARTRSAKLYPRSALVFVHGFGTTFDFALARAAQMSRDIAYDGPTFVFTWPSQGRVDPRAYGPDEAAASASVDQFAEFMAIVAQSSGADTIHVIAHSMGNQILLKALVKIHGRTLGSPAGVATRIGEVVFASPDVGESEFKAQTAALAGTAMTLYASAWDKPLWGSAVRNFERRAGSVTFGLLTSGKPVLTRGVDSIDVSAAGRDWFATNHDVYAANPYVANDLRRLIQTGEHPPNRRSAGVLTAHGQPPEQYWSFNPNATR